MSENSTHRPYVSTLEQFDVSTAERTVTVRKLKTRKGERVEFESVADQNVLSVDALGLESLAWQGQNVFAAYLPDEYDFEPLNSDSDDVTCDVEFKLTNEYAHVILRRLESLEGAVLEVHAPKKRESIQIDANGLSGLAGQDHTVFTGFLEQPHGPEDHH